MKKHLLLYLKGAAMGAADVVPGVSGGTIAFISGIYDQLLEALAKMPAGLLLLLKGRVREAWTLVHANFLLVLLAGIATSILTLARLITWLLEHQAIPLWSFFFGLILVSCWLVGRTISRWGAGCLAAFAVGTFCAWYITVAAPLNWGQDYLSLFFAGAIAICAMILPGVSGSFLLLLMGLYHFVLDAVKGFELDVIAIFALGCLFGLLGFARLLKAALDRFHDLTLALLTGFMLGSLNKVWPWKQTVSFYENSKGQQVPLQQDNLWPWQFAEIGGQDAQLITALLLAGSGVLLVLLLERLAQRKQQNAAADGTASAEAGLPE